jgi:hypothetical protein
MRKSKFSETQIVGMLKDAESGMLSPTSCGSTASAKRPSSNGATSTGAPRCLTSNGCVSSKSKTRS